MMLQEVTLVELQDGELPLVDNEAFGKLECNRCGQCCTNMRPNNEHWGSAHDGALGVLEAYGRYETQGKLMGCVYPDTWETMLFYGQLEAVPAMRKGRQQHYRCGYYQMDEEGRGLCTNYDNRPYMCSGFPYSPDVWSEERQRGEESIVGSLWNKCSWNIRWLDFEVEHGLPV